jgi:hypothetical protein
MSEVTGPISTLPNSLHAVPEGTMCDDHADRTAVARIQGETDSFGSEMHDMCQECLDKHRAYLKSDEAIEHRIGICEWCSNPAEDLRDARDYDEGMCGRLYRVCGPCIRRVNEEAAAELEEMDSYDFPDAHYDDEEEA